MKERPILFSGPMVRAILEGRKTMTRRVVNTGRFKQDDWDISPTSDGYRIFRGSKDDIVFNTACGRPARSMQDKIIRCPYGQPGDRLWVREKFRRWLSPDHAGWIICYAADGKVVYSDVQPEDDMDFFDEPKNWKPSIFMPRWSSRLLLEVTAVRVERVQDISEADARAEGLSEITKDGRLFKYGIPDRDGLPGTDNDGWPWSEWTADPRQAFRKLWNSINAERGYGWDANPWVWVVEFKSLV